MKKILLIGGEGYIGQVVSKYLIDNNYKVLSYDNLIYFKSKKHTNYINNDNYSYEYGDIRNLDKLLELIDKVDHVVLLAGLVGDPITKKYPELAKEINDKAIIDLIDLVSVKNVDRFIFVSTCSNYGLQKSNELANESTELQPLSLYSKSKVNAENYIMSLKNRENFKPTILRFATAFGLSPRMRFDLTVNEFVRTMYKNNLLEIYDQETWRPYCHVLDFARLIHLVLKSDLDKTYFEIFNAGADINNATKKMIVDYIKKINDSKNIKFIENGFDKRNYKVDFKKVKNILGFEAKFSINYGINEIIKELENGNFIDNTEDDYGNYIVYE